MEKEGGWRVEKEGGGRVGKEKDMEGGEGGGDGGGCTICQHANSFDVFVLIVINLMSLIREKSMREEVRLDLVKVILFFLQNNSIK